MVAIFLINPDERESRSPSIKIGFSGLIAAIVIGRLIWVATNAKIESNKANLTQELLNLETSEISPLQKVRSAKVLLNKLEQRPAWNDSRHSITASYLNLVKDSSEYGEYLSYQNIAKRARALLIANALRLTQAQANAEGVGVFKRRLSQASAKKFLDVTQRLSRTGGEYFEIARETPEPFVEETARRGEQAARVGREAFEEAKPVGQRLIKKLDEKQITNPLLGITSLGLFLFMKNKWLAVFLIIGLVLVLKNQQISAAKAGVERILP